MRVEPNDSSYMPSLVVISAGDNIHNLKEIKTVNIGSNEKLVSLLQDMTEVRWLKNHKLLNCAQLLQSFVFFSFDASSEYNNL